MDVPIGNGTSGSVVQVSGAFPAARVGASTGATSTGAGATATTGATAGATAAMGGGATIGAGLAAGVTAGTVGSGAAAATGATAGGGAARTGGVIGTAGGGSGKSLVPGGVPLLLEPSVAPVPVSEVPVPVSEPAPVSVAGGSSVDTAHREELMNFIQTIQHLRIATTAFAGSAVPY